MQVGGGEFQVVHCCYSRVNAVLNVRIKDVTITNRILLIQPKINHKSIKKLTDHLSSDNQKKSDAIFYLENHDIG